MPLALHTIKHLERKTKQHKNSHHQKKHNGPPTTQTAYHTSKAYHGFKTQNAQTSKTTKPTNINANPSRLQLNNNNKTPPTHTATRHPHPPATNSPKKTLTHHQPRINKHLTPRPTKTASNTNTYAPTPSPTTEPAPETAATRHAPTPRHHSLKANQHYSTSSRTLPTPIHRPTEPIPKKVKLNNPPPPPYCSSPCVSCRCPVPPPSSPLTAMPLRPPPRHTNNKPALLLAPSSSLRSPYPHHPTSRALTRAISLCQVRPTLLPLYTLARPTSQRRAWHVWSPRTIPPIRLPAAADLLAPHPASAARYSVVRPTGTSWGPQQLGTIHSPLR